MALMCCEGKRILPKVIERPHVCTALQQKSSNLSVSFEGGQHQESPPEPIRRIHVENKAHLFFKRGELPTFYCAVCLLKGHTVERNYSATRRYGSST